MIKFKDIKNLKKTASQLNDIVADFDVIKNLDYGEAVRYVMKKYSCDVQKASEIVNFTRSHESIC